MSSNKGITLVEVIVAVAIVALMTVVMTTFQSNVFIYNRQTSGSLITTQDARAILRTMVAELRSTSPGSNGAYPILTAATNTISFFSDINGDGSKEQVRYFASSTKLYRGVIVPTGSPLSYTGVPETITLLTSSLRNDSANPIFVYYNGTYNGTSSTTPLVQPVTLTSVRLVKISLILDVDVNSLPVSKTYTSEATLRNLKDNL